MNELPPLQVRFPDEMKVSAPATDHAIDALSKAFKLLATLMEKSLTDINSNLVALRDLPRLVGSVKEELTRQFASLFQHELESQIVARRASVLALEKKKTVIKAFHKEKTEQLKTDHDRVRQRYAALLAQTGEEAELRVRQLDSHALDIVEQIYPRQIQDKFSFESMPSVHVLAAHAADSAEARATCLNEGLEKVNESIDSFLQKRTEFYSAVDNHVERDQSMFGWYELPVLYVETVDSNSGARAVHVAFDVDEKSVLPADLVATVTQIVRNRHKTGRRVALPATLRRDIAEEMRRQGHVTDEQIGRFASSDIEFVDIGGAE